MIGEATAPASSGNLGPGFDTLALALELRCRVVAEPATELLLVERGGETAVGPEDLVARAVAAAVGRPMRLTIDNAIPRARGLGSSAAVAAAAAAAALRACGGAADPDRVFDIVAELEGHADNAAAAVYGGLVAVADRAIRRLEIHPDLRAVVAVPEEALPTRQARRVLPEWVALEVAARSIARAVFLVEGLRTADASALCEAAGDELHEAPRARLSPLTGELITAAMDAGALHAAWSGAGPSVIAFVPSDAAPRLVEALERRLDGAGTVLTPEVAEAGLR